MADVRWLLLPMLTEFTWNGSKQPKNENGHERQNTWKYKKVSRIIFTQFYWYRKLYSMLSIY